MSGFFKRTWKLIVDNLDVSALDIEFKVLRTIKSTPNKAVITVWNMNQDHRAQILKRNQPDANPQHIVGIPVHLEAGYVDNSSTIVQLDLREVSSQRDNNNWKTTLAGDDGGRAWREARISKSFTKGTPISTVLTQCAQAMGVGFGNVGNFSSGVQIEGLGAVLPSNMVLDGSASTQMDRVVKSISNTVNGLQTGLTWSIQNGVLQILPKGTPLNQSAILVSPQTGLIGSPESSIDSSVSLGNPQQFSLANAVAKKPKQPKPKDPGIVRLRTLLIPGLVPGRKIDLESAAFSGGYMITEVEYLGQSWSNEWHCMCVARAY